jgi:hypothetical protein
LTTHEVACGTGKPTGCTVHHRSDVSYHFQRTGRSPLASHTI